MPSETPEPRPAATGLKVCLLASGSKGNCICVSDGETTVLVDAGLSGREIQRRLQQQGVRPADLAGIVVSHEHADHIQGVGVLARRFDLPVYVNRRTFGAGTPWGKIPSLNYFECGQAFEINDMRIHPFSVPHDAEDPAGFTLCTREFKIGIATDLGYATTTVKEHLKNCTLMVVEANHDPQMLDNGPYPWPLKQRIKGRTGHMSNRDCRRLLGELAHGDLRCVILAHLSETNNCPQRALSEVGEVLRPQCTRLLVATQDAGCPWVRL